jgi:hypothetical protein
MFATVATLIEPRYSVERSSARRGLFGRSFPGHGCDAPFGALRTATDVLAVGNCNLRKEDQKPALQKINAQAFELNR